MKKAKTLTGIFAALGISTFVCAGVLGYWKITGSTGNILTMSSFKNQIEEEYHAPAHVDPGQTVDKVVNVKNTGTADSMVRVRIKKMFGETREDGTFVPDDSLDPDMIQIRCNTGAWLYRNDGYYYYKGILKAGTGTREPLFRSYTLSRKADNAYRKKEARIVVTIESVQAQDDLGDIWKISDKELGITRPHNYQSISTEVIYLGRKDGFQMSEKDTDLFASFKNLTPGCARTQKILLENRSEEEIQLYLRAENTAQRSVNNRTDKLVKELLEKYAVIEITGDQGQLYCGPVSGNLSGKSNSMREDIYLGTFKAKESRKLQVKLALSDEMDNRLNELTGKVRWVFTARGDDGKTTASGSVVQTGDRTALGMWIALLGFSVLFLIGAFALERSYSRRD